MIIETRRTAIQLRLRSFLLTVIYALLLILVLGTDVLKQNFLGLNKIHYAIMLTSLFLLYVIYVIMRNTHYVHYNDEGSNIIFRYVSMRPASKKRSIAIPKKTFYKYETQKKFLKEYIILYQKLKEGVAKYPPINVNILTNPQKEAVYQSLDKAKISK
ncbi:MAG: hypothetical protein ACOCWG_05345 [bacterium]